MTNKNITLRYIKESDISDYIRWTTTDIEWYDWDAPWETDDGGNFVIAQMASLEKTPQIYSKLEIDTIDGKHIGWVSSYNINNDHDKTAVGIGIPTVNDRGKGYGKNALTLFMAYLFASKSILYTQTWSGNAAMIRLAESIGFAETGRIKNLREVKGKRYDALTFSITKEDFFAKHPQLLKFEDTCCPAHGAVAQVGFQKISSRLKNQLLFIIEADKMKSVFRQTLLLDKSREETNAEHSWHFALMAMTLYEYAGMDDVNLPRVLKMAILHDLVEIYAGDTPAFDTTGNQDKAAREIEAADKLFSLLPPQQAAEYRSLWEEFDQMETPDAIYAAAVDRLLPFLSNHLTDGHSWVKFGVSADKVYERIAPVKVALPALWGFVEDVVNQGVAMGYIK